MNPKPNQPPEGVLPQTKKGYSKPRLQVYGSLRDITRSVGFSSPKTDPPPHPAPFRTRTK